MRFSLGMKGILHDGQFGFRKRHCTAHALHKSIEPISNNLENDRHLLGVLIDLSEAFDTLDHSIVLKNWKFNKRLRSLSYCKLPH
jgi:hypothetical protein